MMRRLAVLGLLLMAVACGGSGPEPISAEMQAATGSYNLVSVDGDSRLPVAIGLFITPTTGASVSVLGGIVHLKATEMDMSVTTRTVATDPIQGTYTWTSDEFTGGRWTLTGGNFTLGETTSGMKISSATVSGDVMSLTATSSAFGAKGTLRLVFRRPAQ